MKVTLKKIARKWWIKVAIQKVLSFFPYNLSLKTNEWITSKIRGEDRFNSLQRIEKGFSNVELLRDKTGFIFQNKVVLEIGTGWHGIDLIIFYLLGVKKIYTIDRFQHLSLDNLLNQIKSFEQVGYLKEQRLNNRYCDLIEIAHNSDSLKSFLTSINCEYLIIKPKAYGDMSFSEPIDLFYSESVLQRIPEHNLNVLLKKISTEMDDGSIFFHRTDQKDINSQSHVDNQLWSLKYLTYENWVYNLLINSKLNRQNRLRESDFLEKLKLNNLNAIFVQSTYRKKDLELLEDYSVGKKFKYYDDLDICILSSKIVGKKGEPNNKLESKYIAK